VTYTLVAFHAHPDDEALLTGGTLARAAAEGHRVVLVVATAGEAGLARDAPGPQLGQRRRQELADAAAALGCARVEVLGYADSGMYGEAGGEHAFSNADVDVAAARLAEILREEQADVLTVYDPAGGYGHPDHVQVAKVGVRAAELAGTPVVLEATAPGRAFTAVLRGLSFLGHPLGGAPLGIAGVFAPPATITHRVRVRGVLRRKRAAMAAHASQQRGGTGRRAIDRFVRLPLPVFWLVFGRELYVEHGRPAPDRLDDVFASLRRPTRTSSETRS